jgi:hypothetical protein
MPDEFCAVRQNIFGDPFSEIPDLNKLQGIGHCLFSQKSICWSMAIHFGKPEDTEDFG